MARIFIFDSDPAGLVCHDPGSPERGGVWNWMFKEWSAGAIIVIPAIVDYEIRRFNRDPSGMVPSPDPSREAYGGTIEFTVT